MNSRTSRGAVGTGWESLERRRMLSASAQGAGTVGTANVAAANAAALTVPVLNSRPGAARQLYLDFDGAPAFYWRPHSVPATPAFTRDADPTTFSADDITALKKIWQQVADMYAAFDINVTTVAPAALADRVALAIIVGGHGEWLGRDAGGYFYGGVNNLGSFTNSTDNRGFAFADNYKDAAYPDKALAEIGRTVAHEAGHGFGLEHHSEFDANGTVLGEYANGPNDQTNTGWIMGRGGMGRRAVWARAFGRTYGQIQDDATFLGNLLGTVGDSEGNTAATAVAIGHTGRSLDSGAFTHGLQSITDKDYFRFDTAGGTVDVSAVTPNGGMLDLNLELRDAAGRVLAADTGFESMYIKATHKRVFATVPAGTYYLVVSSAGGPGNIGTYWLAGTEGLATKELSKGRPYTASSVSPYAGSAVSNAADHNDETKWLSKPGAPQWLQVDLGQVSTVSEVDLTLYGAFALTGHQFQISADGKNWTTFQSVGQSTVEEETLTGLNVAGRYVRVLITGLSNPENSISIAGFHVYGTAASAPPPTPVGTDLARSGTAAASSSDNSTRGPARAIDGNASTRWASASSDNQWIQVDLKSVQAITGVRLNWEAAFAKAYKIQFSNDGQTWTDKASVTTGDGGVDEISLSGSARYVRMQGITRATKYGYSLYDFNIYGGGTTPPPTGNTASISGFAFNDSNRNGVFDTGDGLAGGKTVWLDLDDDGVKDANEVSVTTAADGSFRFTGLTAGTYHVRRLFPSGYVESSPPRVITLTAGQSVSGVAIGSRTK